MNFKSSATHMYVTSQKYSEINLASVSKANGIFTPEEYIRRAFGTYHFFAGPLQDSDSYIGRLYHARSGTGYPLEMMIYGNDKRVLIFRDHVMDLLEGEAGKIGAGNIQVPVSLPKGARQLLSKEQNWLEVNSYGEVLLAACNFVYYLTLFKDDYTALTIQDKLLGRIWYAMRLDSLFTLSLNEYV